LFSFRSVGGAVSFHGASKTVLPAVWLFKFRHDFLNLSIPQATVLITLHHRPGKVEQVGNQHLFLFEIIINNDVKAHSVVQNPVNSDDLAFFDWCEQCP
jgi:hypothetical protein